MTRPDTTGEARRRLRRRELTALAITVSWATVAFLPAWRAPELAGIAIFGWLMAALMVMAPVLALLALRAGRR